MAESVQNFVRLAGFYNELLKVMSAICAGKGAAIENYVGRFFTADLLEFIAEYGQRLEKNSREPVAPEVSNLVRRFNDEFDRFRDLVTPNEKPIHEMTLEEFEKVMNI